MPEYNNLNKLKDNRNYLGSYIEFIYINTLVFLMIRTFFGGVYMLTRRIFISVCCLVLLLCLGGSVFGSRNDKKYDGTFGKGRISITVATGSPGSLGLLQALAESFCDNKKCRINWIKRGSGASLNALKSGEVDMIMVHAPEAEEKLLKRGGLQADV